jgi:hypothetical protein
LEAAHDSDELGVLVLVGVGFVGGRRAVVESA